MEENKQNSLECTLEKNRQNCPCPHDGCPRKGACCQCVAYHREKGDLPMCFRK